MRRRQSAIAGFTLVELLVVIGIIAALIALLLPTLAGARRAAAQVKCAAQIQQVLSLVQNHAVVHRGFLPLVGLLPGSSITPAGLNDPSRLKYDYLSTYAGDDTLICFTASFAQDLGDPRVYQAQTFDQINTAEMDPNGFVRIFLCPAHLSTPDFEYEPIQYIWYPVSTTTTSGGWQYWTESQSYIYNEAALGWNDSLNRTRGQLARIHSQSQTMLMADGLGGDPARGILPGIPPIGIGFSTVYNKVPVGPVTLADALAGNANAGDPQNFDTLRHRGRMNIGFFDGHVETRNISVNDLQNVYLIAPK